VNCGLTEIIDLCDHKLYLVPKVAADRTTDTYHHVQCIFYKLVDMLHINLFDLNDISPGAKRDKCIWCSKFILTEPIPLHAFEGWCWYLGKIESKRGMKIKLENMIEFTD